MLTHAGDVEKHARFTKGHNKERPWLHGCAYWKYTGLRGRDHGHSKTLLVLGVCSPFLISMSARGGLHQKRTNSELFLKALFLNLIVKCSLSHVTPCLKKSSGQAGDVAQ